MVTKKTKAMKDNKSSGVGGIPPKLLLETVDLDLTTDLTRFATQAKSPDGKWTRKPLAYRESTNVDLRVTRPPEICVNLVKVQQINNSRDREVKGRSN